MSARRPIGWSDFPSGKSARVATALDRRLSIHHTRSILCPDSCRLDLLFDSSMSAAKLTMMVGIDTHSVASVYVGLLVAYRLK